jgi:two-component system, autoinducer 1 sensor kinase/phosphatase LuxN
VVDDNRAVHEVLPRMLSFLGYEVTLAGNGIEAGTLFLTGSYDLVITDLQMPLMNGWELSRLIKERSPNTPVMVVSGACGDFASRTVPEGDWRKMPGNHFFC